MKNSIILFLTILISATAFGQDNNKRLYQAILKKDTISVRQLLSEKADPNYIEESGSWMKVNMLITAVNNGNIEIVKMLISNKADVNWKDGFNTTAIIYAASTGNKDIVVLLLENGANITDNDGQGNTVLSAAKESKNKDLIKFVESKLKQKK
ncbi:MAG TPA: ankyrin repeat domain-containing protein [Edaphocola sp.]|nr:ankyrin repeat domain-containing protein [Edaphocola sp.]